jgi:hypothetical protein
MLYKTQCRTGSNPVLTTKNEVMRSKVLQRLIDEMEKDPWYVKLRRWWRVKIWIYKCRTRKYWDKTYQNYLFKKK